MDLDYTLWTPGTSKGLEPDLHFKKDLTPVKGIWGLYKEKARYLRALILDLGILKMAIAYKASSDWA
jgi:hypothetical protein